MITLSLHQERLQTFENINNRSKTDQKVPVAIPYALMFWLRDLEPFTLLPSSTGEVSAIALNAAGRVLVFDQRPHRMVNPDGISHQSLNFLAKDKCLFKYITQTSLVLIIIHLFHDCGCHRGRLSRLCSIFIISAGGSSGDRTPDTMIKSHVLYRLS